MDINSKKLMAGRKDTVLYDVTNTFPPIFVNTQGFFSDWIIPKFKFPQCLFFPYRTENVLNNVMCSFSIHFYLNILFAAWDLFH